MAVSFENNTRNSLSSHRNTDLDLNNQITLTRISQLSQIMRAMLQLTKQTILSDTAVAFETYKISFL